MIHRSILSGLTNKNIILASGASGTSTGLKIIEKATNVQKACMTSDHFKR